MRNRFVKIGIGAVIIVLLMVSSATAINVVQSETTTTQKKDVYVDPNICLTKTQLSKLQQAVQFIDDPQDKAIVEQIIKTLQENGKVNSNDIKDIVHTLNINDRSFYFGSLNVEGKYCPGKSFPIHLIRYLLLAGLGTFGTMIIGSWSVSGSYGPTPNSPYCKINGRYIFSEQANKGVALLGFGSHMQFLGANSYGWFNAFCALIIVSPAQ